jgi:YHS domain-containing protein
MSRLIRFLRGLLAACVLLGAPQIAAAAKPETYTGLIGDVAVGGYDVVSFFQGAPVKGADANKATYKGAVYLFATPENAGKFKSNPAAYAPQYGGYCAWATAQGKTAPGNPKFWRLVNGKLYLNYDAGVQKKWEKDIPGFIAKADANWPGILK